MIDYILNLFHPEVNREWEAFYPDNGNAIAKFLFHSESFPRYHNPIDRCTHRHAFLRSLPKKFKGIKIRDLLDIAPYRMKQFVLANKTFVIEAFEREQHYNEVINLLDSCKYGVTSVCNKHFSFTLLGGARLPKGESFLDSFDVNMRLHHLIGIGAISDRISFFEEKSKRGERTPQDVTSIKNAQSVDYDDLDVYFQELYPYCDEIKSEEKRVVAKLHEEDVNEKFNTEVAGNERKNLYYKDFLKAQNHHKDTSIEQKEYCLQHMHLLDTFVSKKLEQEADDIANRFPLGYEWFETSNSNIEIGEMLEGDDFLFDCIKRKDLIQKKHEVISRYKELQSLYPNAIAAYNDAHKVGDDNLSKIFVPSYEEIINLGETKLKEYELNAQKMAFHKNWITSQVEYSKYCRDARDRYLSTWGCYRYKVPFESITYDGNNTQKNFSVWQMFPQSFCLDDSLDYTYNASVIEKTKNLLGFKNKQRYFKESLYDTLLSFINCLYEKYGGELVVLFGTSGIEDCQSFNDYHFGYLSKQLTTKGIQFRQIEKEPRSITEKAYYVIIEVITENSHFQDTCQQVLNLKHHCYNCSKPKSYDCFSDIVYISLNKCYDSDEMKSIISDTKKKIERQKEIERKKHEEENKKREEERLLKQKEREVITKLQNAVLSWDTFVGGIKCSYLFYYYPTTCDFEATEEEWYYRRLVWDFKNTPGKTSFVAHQIALERALSMVKNKLSATFEEDNMKHLTLVCIPASSQLKTQARYETFSNRICAELGMINAYPHISVITEREERHLGGMGMNTSQLSFDTDFFKGKNVLLFDDIITRGDSMRMLKGKMESLGATVIGGLSLGKTKHDRPIQGIIPKAFKPSVFPPPLNNSSDVDNDVFPF